MGSLADVDADDGPALSQHGPSRTGVVHDSDSWERFCQRARAHRGGSIGEEDLRIKHLIQNLVGYAGRPARNWSQPTHAWRSGDLSERRGSHSFLRSGLQGDRRGVPRRRSGRGKGVGSLFAWFSFPLETKQRHPTPFLSDVAQAWADYHVTTTGIGRDMYIASSQLNVAQVNAADPSTFSYVYPQSGSSSAPMMMGGVSALPWRTERRQLSWAPWACRSTRRSRLLPRLQTRWSSGVSPGPRSDTGASTLGYFGTCFVEYLLPWNNPPAQDHWGWTAGKWAGWAMFVVGSVGAVAVEAAGVGGTVIFGGGAGAAEAVAAEEAVGTVIVETIEVELPPLVERHLLQQMWPQTLRPPLPPAGPPMIEFPWGPPWFLN